MQQTNLNKLSLIEQNENELARFELISAGLVNFLPGISIDEHGHIFQQVRTNQQLNNIEQYNGALVSQLCFEGQAADVLMQLKKSPAVICTMHTGAYRLLNLYLIKENIPFAIVMGTKVLQEQGKTFQGIFRSYHNNAVSSLQLIDAEQPNAVRQMLKALTTGKSLVLYMDGQTGAGDDTASNKNNCVVNFLAQQLYTRKGIAWLAHLAKTPIIPILSYRKGTMNSIRCYPPINPDRETDRELFAQVATQQLYDKFAEFIKEEPGQWEGWLNIHKTVKIIRDTSLTQMKGNKKGKNLLFNSFRFGIFKTGGLTTLFEKHRYLFYPVDTDLYQLLQECRQAPLPVSQVKKEVVNELLEKGMLIRV